MKKWGILFLFALTACSSPDESADSERSVIVVYSPHGPDVGKDYERLFEEAAVGGEVRTLAGREYRRRHRVATTVSGAGDGDDCHHQRQHQHHQ